MTAFQDVLPEAMPAERQRLFAVMLNAIAGHRVGNPPGRVEPRATNADPGPGCASQSRGRQHASDR